MRRDALDLLEILYILHFRLLPSGSRVGIYLVTPIDVENQGIARKLLLLLSKHAHRLRENELGLPVPVGIGIYLG